MQKSLRLCSNGVCRYGWLVVFWYYVVFSMTRWASLHGWSKLCEPGVPQRGKGHRTIPWRQDLMHAGLTAASILLYGLTHFDLAWGNDVVLAVAIARTIGIFFDQQMLAIFGNDYGRPWLGRMRPQRTQRTIFLGLLTALQIVFWYAIIYHGLSRHELCGFEKQVTQPSHALQTSFSTMTTIGYGTYAPNTNLTVSVTIVQSITSILLLVGLLPALFSRATERSSRQHDLRTNPPTAPIIWEDGRGWTLRLVTPLLVPALVAAVVFCCLWR